MSKDYFIGVCDVEQWEGKKDNMELQATERFFGKKFVDTPEKAILNLATDVLNGSRSYWTISEEEFDDLFDGFTYDPNTKEYIIERYWTQNWNVPTDYQMDKFNEGEYSFYKEKIYFQILKTELVEQECFKKGYEDFKKQRWHNK